MPPSFLIYHPARQSTTIGNMTIYHDMFGGNEDPYIWNDRFLHSYCHITQLSNEIGQINFWISGDIYPNFTQLFCDCVFVVSDKLFWENNNYINSYDRIVDNNQTFEHHYKWVNHKHHYYKKRNRYTLKADSKMSFQPQDSNRNLIDILPFLNQNNLTTEILINSMTSRRGSRPFRLDSNLGRMLYDFLFSTSAIKLFGEQLKNIHPNKIN